MKGEAMERSDNTTTWKEDLLERVIDINRSIGNLTAEVGILKERMNHTVTKADMIESIQEAVGKSMDQHLALTYAQRKRSDDKISQPPPRREVDWVGLSKIAGVILALILSAFTGHQLSTPQVVEAAKEAVGDATEAAEDTDTNLYGGQTVADF
jgi:hypothetical protein